MHETKNHIYTCMNIMALYKLIGCSRLGEWYMYHYSVLWAIVFIGLKYWIRTWNSIIVYGNHWTSTVIKYVYTCSMYRRKCEIRFRIFFLVIATWLSHNYELYSRNYNLNYVVITRSFLVITRTFLVIRRSFLVTEIFSRNYELICL